METAKAFGYPGWSAWEAEHPQVRAKLMAHELHRGMRETYNFEQRMAAGETADKPKNDAPPWQKIRERFFGDAKP